MEFFELASHEIRFPGRIFAAQPEHPVPEVAVDTRQRLRRKLPRRLGLMRLIGEDQIDLYRPAQDQHRAHSVTETIPLLDDRVKRRAQGWQIGCDLLEVVRLDDEVPIGATCGAPVRSRADELSQTHRRMGANRGNHPHI